MNALRKVLDFTNAFISFILTVFILFVGAYSAYALWDNNQIYTQADVVKADMLRIKPTVEAKEGEEVKASFAELLAINPEVRAWVTLDNTKIDFPVLQGSTNLSYINTDVYGEFSLAGSIFLDSRSDGGFHDQYSLLYGHHMVDGKMFGDLALFKEEEFFKTHEKGNLILPDRSYNLVIFAVLIVPSSDDMIFDIDHQKGGLGDLIKYTKEHALYNRSEIIESLKQDSKENLKQVLAFSTCSTEFTDARTVVLAMMVPTIPKE